jgi:DNA polymerase-3 subunit chi
LGLIDFYQLAAVPIERVLPRICERVIEGGERLLIVAEPPLAAQLDAMLWTYAPDAFLPHGRSEAPGAESQPILLSERVEALNGAANVALADGRWRSEALGFARTFFFFDSAHVADARTAWRTLKGTPGAELRYWKQDDRGKWVQGP